MEITIQVSRGCPHRSLAEERVRTAVAAAGRADLAVREVVVADDCEGGAGFGGSPTILIDGRDPFNRFGDGHNPSCRLYRTEHGLEGAPSVAAIRRAIEEAVRGPGQRNDH